MNVTDPLINPLFLSVIVKDFVITKCSVVDIQNLTVNPISGHIKSNSEQYQFLFKYVSSKNQWLNFQNEEKTLVWGHFCTKGIFPKNSG